MQMIWNGEIK